MKYIGPLILMFSWSFCFGQSVRFQLFRTGPCTIAEQLDTLYYLFKAPNSIDTSFFPKKGIVYLPDTGKYRIYFIEGPRCDTTIDIRDTGIFAFRYKEPDVAVYPGGIDMPPVYANCRKRITGYFETFYPNGTIRMRGDFVSGYPEDSLVTYYSNGALKSKERVFKKETVIEKFDSLSRRTKIMESQNGSIISYRWRKSTAFFPGGRIKLKESDIRSIKKIKEYFPNGRIKIEQTTKHRFEFYESGRPKVRYSWKKYFDRAVPPGKGTKDFVVTQTNYDRNGGIFQIMIFDVNDVFGSPPKLELDKDNWLDSLTKYINGKVVFKLVDIDAKEYLEKYVQTE